MQQPLSVAVDAGSSAFQLYKSGVITEDDGCGTGINHAVVVVGYTDEADAEPEPEPEPPTPEPEPPVTTCKVTKWWTTCKTEEGRRL
jgi:hypothetical protein